MTPLGGKNQSCNRPRERADARRHDKGRELRFSWSVGIRIGNYPSSKHSEIAMGCVLYTQATRCDAMKSVNESQT